MQQKNRDDFNLNSVCHERKMGKMKHVITRVQLIREIFRVFILLHSAIPSG